MDEDRFDAVARRVSDGTPGGPAYRVGKRGLKIVEELAARGVAEATMAKALRMGKDAFRAAKRRDPAVQEAIDRGRATEHDKALLADIMRRMEAAHADDDTREEAEIDIEFHNAICESAHNLLLMHALRSCYRVLANGVFFSRALVYGLPGARDELLKQHRAVHDAIMAGDAAAAKRAAEAHMEFVEKYSLEAERAKSREAVSRLRRAQRLQGAD